MEANLKAEYLYQLSGIANLKAETVETLLEALLNRIKGVLPNGAHYTNQLTNPNYSCLRVLPEATGSTTKS